MYLRFDESGDFDFRNSERFALAVVAGVAIPDRSWAEVEAFVAAKTAAWGMPREIKGSALDQEQQAEVIEFLAAAGIAAVAVISDSRIFPAEEQSCWRQRQMKLFEAAVERSRRVHEDQAVRERVEDIARWLPNEQRLKQPNFLQYFILTPRLIALGVAAALRANRDLAWDQDRWTFEIAFDPREGADPGKAGKLLRASIEAIFVSDERTALMMPAEWPDDHPFKVRNADSETGCLSPRQVFIAGLETRDSHEDPGIQLADVVAHVIFSALRHGTEDDLALWRRLRPLMYVTEEQLPFYAWHAPRKLISDEEEARYRQLLEG